MLQPAALCLAVMVAALGPALDALPRYRRIAIGAVLALLIVPGLSHFRAGRTADVDLALWTPARLAASGFETTTAAEIPPKWSSCFPPPSPRTAVVASGEAEIADAVHTPIRVVRQNPRQKPPPSRSTRSYLPRLVRPGRRRRGQRPFPAQRPAACGFSVEPGDHNAR